MESQAYLKVEQQLREWAARVGAPNIGDEALERGQRSEGGARHPLEPRQRLLARLEALERHVILMHRGTYEAAMVAINKALVRGAQRLDRRPNILTSASVAAELPGEPEPVKIPFESLPDLTLPLKRIRILISRIQEDGDDDAG